MLSLMDQIGRKVELKATPRKIISVVPSQTELLYSLKLDKEVVGITKFCVHPHSWFKSKQRIGGTKTLKLEAIDAIQPDLIIANKEENTASEIIALQKQYPVYTSDINNLNDSLSMIRDVGVLVGKQDQANNLVKEIKQQFDQLNVKHLNGKSVLYLIWKSPNMSIGKDTFISDMMLRCGLSNIMQDTTRYPELSETQSKQLKPDFVFLSSEPFPFSAKHIDEFQALFPQSKVVLVDGEYFSWYGSRLKDAPKYFEQLLNKIQ